MSKLPDKQPSLDWLDATPPLQKYLFEGSDILRRDFTNLGFFPYSKGEQTQSMVFAGSDYLRGIYNKANQDPASLRSYAYKLSRYADKAKICQTRLEVVRDKYTDHPDKLANSIRFTSGMKGVFGRRILQYHIASAVDYPNYPNWRYDGKKPPVFRPLSDFDNTQITQLVEESVMSNSVRHEFWLNTAIRVTSLIRDLGIDGIVIPDEYRPKK